ncbi:hypothetical protein F909_03592 [Acinetobacter sp. ANC 3929]|uniref:hypothetical protein n=1 Tax=Acinetobacter sp. ANC 3929 TaxID=1217707 RepID=UPI0002D07CC9|nr:hypothetical protein [Acinetobacter sp. ANC 3929]ENW78630.1 hypothetical protein F909_03592 [Acinetobacter sp. ANC 3929]
MEQNVLNHNRSYAIRKGLLKKCTVAALGVGVLTGTYALVTKPMDPAPVYSYANTQSVYGPVAVQITSDTTGQAVVNLDGFRVYASFDFELIEEWNGALGGEQPTIHITNLAVDQVFTPDGGSYGDFTNADDIRNMISIITAHIQKNKMVEGV